jgi:hypothetical protein
MVEDRGKTGYGRSVPAEWDRVDPKTGSDNPDACYASGWRDALEHKIFALTTSANLSSIITDGPYGGGICASTNHSHHHDVADSVFQQNRLQAEFYHKMAAKGVFVRSAYGRPGFDGVSHDMCSPHTSLATFVYPPNSPRVSAMGGDSIHR